MERTSMQYDMIRNALKGITDNHTIRAYKRDIKEFSSWAKENEIKKSELGKDVIQKYTDVLVEKGYSPTTIHRYIAPVCKGLGVSMDEISKPRRTADTIVRSRNEDANKQGKMEAQQERFERVVSFQSAVGIRRAELRRLPVDCIRTDESGYMCVLVKKGKGGKMQLQRILPQNIEIVEKTIATAKSKNVFETKEMSNKIDFHELRANVAKEAYSYYENRLKTDLNYRKQLQIEIVNRWNACRGKHSEESLKKFLRDVYGSEVYEISKANKMRAIENGTPLAYDRLALMAVSVFHLSHWRLDVTVTNYLV